VAEFQHGLNLWFGVLMPAAEPEETRRLEGKSRFTGNQGSGQNLIQKMIRTMYDDAIRSR
jgi:hypothetical protein